ncbi:MAG TPA: hypothetical protein VET24_02065 [Actinomycetota bacterium]|nr:hypothetical protein [Actinomycetota bacterium]
MRPVPYAESPDTAELFPDDPEEVPRPVRGTRPRYLSAVAAGAILVGGYVHYCLYHGFRSIPKIGTGFLIQVLSSVVVAGALVAGRERVLDLGHLVVWRTAAIRVAGLMLSIGTLAAFALTRTPVGLFNFTERGLQPAPQAVIALVAESLAVVLLGMALVADRLHPQAATQRSGNQGRITANVRLGDAP